MFSFIDMFKALKRNTYIFVHIIDVTVIIIILIVIIVIIICIIMMNIMVCIFDGRVFWMIWIDRCLGVTIYWLIIIMGWIEGYSLGFTCLICLLWSQLCWYIKGYAMLIDLSGYFSCFLYERLIFTEDYASFDGLNVHYRVIVM